MVGPGTTHTHDTERTNATYRLRVTVRSTGPSNGVPLFDAGTPGRFETRQAALSRAEEIRSDPDALRRFGVDPDRRGESIDVQVVQSTPIEAADIARLRRRWEENRIRTPQQAGIEEGSNSV